MKKSSNSCQLYKEVTACVHLLTVIVTDVGSDICNPSLTYESVSEWNHRESTVQYMGVFSSG